MLLKDFRSTNDRQISAVNEFLSENFGVKLNPSDIDGMISTRDSLAESLSNMKKDSYTMTDQWYTKLHLTVNALSMMIESEQDSERKHRAYKTNMDALFQYCVNLVDIGDDPEDAVRDAMRQYRSSKYRFPDGEVEIDLIHRVNNYVANMEKEVAEECITEEEQGDLFGYEDDEAADGNEDHTELWFCDECTLGLVNDDYSGIGDDDRADEVIAAVQNLPPNVSLGNETEEFSTDPCDCCGTPLAGSRYQFWVL